MGCAMLPTHIHTNWMEYQPVQSPQMLLDVSNLKTHFFLREGVIRAVDGVDFTMRRGVTLGVVGESGCGKSVMAFSILKLVNKPGRVVEGKILFERSGGGASRVVDLAAFGDNSPEMRDIR